MYEETTRRNVGGNSRNQLGGMQNFVRAMENLRPQTFGRGAIDLVNGIILTHYCQSHSPNFSVISAL
jgi:hypothetical protein